MFPVQPDKAVVLAHVWPWLAREVWTPSPSMKVAERAYPVQVPPKTP